MAEPYEDQLRRSMRRRSLRTLAGGGALVATGLVILFTAPPFKAALQVGYGLSAIGLLLAAVGALGALGWLPGTPR